VTATGGVTSFFLVTLRLTVAFLAFLEGLSPFFFAIRLFDDAAAYMPSKRGESEAAHGRGARLSMQAIILA